MTQLWYYRSRVRLVFFLIELLAVSTHDAPEISVTSRTTPPLLAAGIHDEARSMDSDGNGNDEYSSSRRNRAEDDDLACRVAVCFSGHIRSFVYPSVHRSAKRNLVGAIAAAGCQVDVFAYATLPDTIPSFKAASQSGGSPFTPSMERAEASLAVLQPVDVVWHQDQAGIIPNACPEETKRGQASYYQPNDPDGGDAEGWWANNGGTASENLYWQLYKSLASFKMAEAREEREGFRYDWVVRTRFDLAWIRPMPSIRAFANDSVWFGIGYWPISDPFAVIPRHLADGYFSAVSAYYTCDGESWPPSEVWYRPVCIGGGFEESVLYRHLAVKRIPYRVYSSFQYSIVRGGKRADFMEQITGFSLYARACAVVGVAGLLRTGFSQHDCCDALTDWAELRMRTLFVGGDRWSTETATAMTDGDHRTWERLLTAPLVKPDTALEAARGTRGAIEPELTIGKAEREEDTAPKSKTSKGQAGDAMYHSVEDRSKNAATLAVVHARLRDLRDALVVTPSAPVASGSSVGATLELDPWKIHTLVTAPNGCPYGEHQGRAPHLVRTVNNSASLALEYAVAVKCLAHSIGGGQGGGGGADRGQRPPLGATDVFGHSGVGGGGVTGDGGVGGGYNAVSSSGGGFGDGSSNAAFLDGVELELCRHARSLEMVAIQGAMEEIKTAIAKYRRWTNLTTLLNTPSDIASDTTDFTSKRSNTRRKQYE